uniref:Protein kinase domain-containing protein n=1 Tax=Araucaria cunninghamii TaxID=56994 RepID=A0A0D6QRZ0_ARACU
MAADSESVYALAQCWPTLTNATCQECLQDAQRILSDDCLPRHDGRGLEAGCFMRYSTYPFFSDNTSYSPPFSGNGKSKLLPILLGSIGGGALMAALCVIIIMKCSRKRFNALFLPVGPHGGYATTEGDLAARETFEQVIFDYEVLKDATENFGGRNLLGKGGFGEVYKGRLADGRVIAVKKLSDRSSTQAMDEFLTEVKLISSVRHRNLVRLLGCCTHGHERLLVYEFMANNSLHKHLFGDTETHLDWNTRFNITVGTARGLAYLHEDSNVRIVHRDIKAGNILLDDKFHPKVADFGLAKFFPEGESHVSTRVGGTLGYMAPEYAVHGQLSEKADVFSYGVVVLEIVTGRKSMNTGLPEPHDLLLQWAWSQYESDQVLDIVDPRLEGEYPREQTLKTIIIALLCTQGSPALRPAMSQVLSNLTSDSEIAMRPTKPAFIDAIANVNAPASKPADSAHSHGSITVSLFPR